MISDKYADYAEKLGKLLNNAEIRASIDNRSEKIGKKIRDAEMKKTPYMLIIGEKEANDGMLSVRRHKEGDLGSMSPEQFIAVVKEEIHKTLN